METVQITTIVNTLANRRVVFFNDSHDMVILDPGQAQMNYTDLRLPIISEPGDVTGLTVRRFDVEGHPIPYAYAVVENQGMTSALGTESSHVFPSDVHRIHVTFPEIAPGQNVKLTFQEDMISDGTLVTWVLGELEEAI